ncbi:MAG: hypothetical protein DRQ78_08510 [Epsilonproteobacteria bacterium]|nr:MAG: hypothetical protein DRQ78_08510 [Campylobacterota bacterium]
MSEQELKYYERLDIPVLTINQVKDMIRSDIYETINCWKQEKQVDRQTYRIIGPAGVGKTAICYQLAQELTELIFGEYNQTHPDDKKFFEILMVKAPVLAREDFIVPFPVRTDDETFSFKMLYSDFVPKKKNSFGLFVIDEFSRGDHRLQQLLWQILNEFSVHRLSLPKGWFVISVDNPDDSEYSMDVLQDAAGLRRQLQVYVHVSSRDFLEYAIKSDFHPLVIEFIQTHPEYVYDFKSQKQGAVYANPASWEKVSDHLWKLEKTYGKLDFTKIENRSAGLLNTHMAQMFIEFARDKKDINPKDIFYDFPNVKAQVKELVHENNVSKLTELMISFCTFLSTSRPDYTEKELRNIADFLLSVPVDTAALFVTEIDSLPKSSDAFRYITEIHIKLVEVNEQYRKDFYETLVRVGQGDYEYRTN